MKSRKILSLLMACLFALGCLTTSTGAVVTSNLDAQTILRATGQFEASIPANSIKPVGESISLDIGETVTYNCTYTPKSASVKFGFIAPDGLFYGLSGSDGSINRGIRVNQRGTYTLAIKNNSSSAVTVSGTVNY